MLAAIWQTAEGYLVDVSEKMLEKCLNFEQVANLIAELMKPYSNVCWNCHVGLLRTAANSCRKCRKFVVCRCGKCLCDNPAYKIRPALTDQERQAILNRVIKDIGHLLDDGGPK